jgi:chromosome segregation ATPase
MSQSDVTSDVRSKNHSTSPKTGNVSRSEHLASAMPRNQASSTVTAQSAQAQFSPGQAPPSDYTAVLAELEQYRSLNQQRLRRIEQLEQVLDQALAFVSELQGRVQDMDLLETQLAMTEDFANVQQQAIVRLKRQLHEQQSTLEAQDAELQARDQALRELQQMLDLRQQEITGLEAQVESYQRTITALETQVASAQDETQTLSAQLQEWQHRTETLVAQLTQAYSTLDNHENLTLTLSRTQRIVAELQTRISTLEKDLAIAQMKVEDLENQRDKQARLQASLQQTCQELTTERDRQLVRISELEQDTATMQEQIFQQAKQASELETAIQYWKDHYLSSQQQLSYFKKLLDQAMPGQTAETTFDTHIPVTPALLELLTAIQLVHIPEHTDASAPAPSPTPRLTTLDVPDFLLRRRYRARSS